MSAARDILGRLAGAAAAFHRDERGDAFEYILVMIVFGVPLIALSDILIAMLSDYFEMIAFHVGWPFL